MEKTLLYIIYFFSEKKKCYMLFLLQLYFCIINWHFRHTFFCQFVVHHFLLLLAVLTTIGCCFKVAFRNEKMLNIAWFE
jgi:hypothetical protein